MEYRSDKKHPGWGLLHELSRSGPRDISVEDAQGNAVGLHVSLHAAAQVTICLTRFFRVVLLFQVECNEPAICRN